VDFDSLSPLILSEHPVEIACPGDIARVVLMYPGGLAANQPWFIVHRRIVTHRWRMKLRSATGQ
jgi:hypothetical protein